MNDQSVALPDRLLSEHEAASLLGISLPTLRRWRYRRRGPSFVRFRRTIRYRRADIVAFIIAHFGKGADDAT